MKVELLSSDDVRILAFLESNSHFFFHTPIYARFIKDSFSGDYQFVVALDDDAIRSLLPIVVVKSRIFGRRIISSAYLEYGGFAGDEKNIPLMLDWLKEKYGEKFDYLEVRGGGEIKFDLMLSSLMVKKDLYKRFVLDLRGVPDNSGDSLNHSSVPKSKREPKTKIEYSVFNTVKFSSGSVPAVEFFRSNIQDAKRKAINKAKRNNVVVKDVPLDDLDTFYNLYCQNMRRFGSPPYAKVYFENFYQHLANKSVGKIYGAYLDGKLAAALLGLCYGDRVHIIIAVSDEKKREDRPNDAVHSEFIEWAIENKFHFFDFGRVREESGQFEYKQKWGPTLMELPSYFMLWKKKEIPVVDPKKYEFVVGVWKRLPLRVTKMIGHKLRKELGI